MGGMKKPELDPDVIQGLVAFSILTGNSKEIIEKSPVKICREYEKCLGHLGKFGLVFTGKKKSHKQAFNKWVERWSKKLR